MKTLFHVLLGILAITVQVVPLVALVFLSRGESLSWEFATAAVIGTLCLPLPHLLVATHGESRDPRAEPPSS